MLIAPIQFACVAASTLLLAAWCADQWRRQMQSWGAIAARVRPVAATSSAWVRFRSAGVAMEMADYAERRCRGFDPAAVVALREDAVRARVAAARSMVRLAGSRHA